ncbi:MAG: Ig domain-containing protein [Bacteroidales bacterium]|nr:Ig domain-containing protein [Candidatus Colimorpha onthohippi]
MKKSIPIVSMIVLAIGLLCSCEKEESAVSITDVRLNQTELTIAVGDPDVKLIATITPENASDKSISWSSDQTDVAIVDQEGNVHAVAEGNANITVTTKDGGKTATCAVTVKAAKREIETIADVLATVVGGFPEDLSGENTPVAPSNAWVNGIGSSAFVHNKTTLILQKYDDNSIPLTTSVSKEQNCYTASVSNGTLTFNMTNDILTSFEFKATNEEDEYDGIYNPVQAELTMKNGDTESDWNKITITIKGTDIISASYYFDKTSVVNAAGNLEELVQSNGITLIPNQIESINSAEGIHIVKEDLQEETRYTTVVVVSTSAGLSKTIVATKGVGQAPPM